MNLPIIVRHTAVAIAVLLAAPTTSRGVQGQSTDSTRHNASSDRVAALVAAFDTMARRELWPNFRPDTIPLAIFDGTRTFLVRQASPPPEFTRVERGEIVAEMNGRHAAVTANSSADIGGRTTATVMPRFDGSTPRELAAVTIHEAFHVFQRARHPTWTANEADLFTYPFDDVAALAGRRLEFEALRRALRAQPNDSAACWGRAALGERTRRFARLGEIPAQYERRGELNEGLANYVQLRAAATPALAGMKPEELPADKVRDRTYLSGAALGQLLDRLDRSWRQELELADSGAVLDAVLARGVGAGAPACTFSARETAEATRTARRDVAAFVARLAAERRRFEHATGAGIVVDASRATLFVNGFDPLNVSRLSAADVLHRRYLALKNGGGELEVINHQALTVSAGSHPLFAGAKRVTITGLLRAPDVKDVGGAVDVAADGIRLHFKGATVTRAGRRVTITLAPQK